MSKNKDNQLYIRGQFVPNTLDAEKRTVDVTFATDTPVLRYSWGREEYYFEVLDMDGADLSRASRSGLPVLDNHSAWGSVARSVLGRAENIRKEGNTWAATVRFSNRPEVEGLVSDVRDGIITDISFGYSVDKVERMEKEDGEQYRKYMVRKWTPSEVSFVTIPADPRAGVRSADGSNDTDLMELYEQTRSNEKPQNNKHEYTMKREQIIALLEKRGIKVDASISDEALNAELERALGEKGEDPEQVRKAAIEAERKRTSDITAAVRAAKLDQKFADTLINDGKTIDEARAAIIEELAKDDKSTEIRAANPHVGTDRERQMRQAAIQAQLIQRGAPDLVRGEQKIFTDDELKEANKYRHMTLFDIARDSLVRSGVDVEGLDRMEIVGRAFTSSTSDFPVLLEGTNRRTLLAAYNIQSDTWRRFCATGSVSDFRDYERIMMGTFSNLDSVEENGEYKTKPIPDGAKEKVRVGTKGNLINVTRKMIINDDLGAFLRLATGLGRAAARSIEQDVYNALALNSGNGPTMADGNPLFHASHNNIMSAAAPTVAVLDLMRQKIAQQKDLSGNDFLDLRLALALCPTSLGSTLRLLNEARYEPTADMFEKPNVVAGLFREVIDTPRLSGTKYYGFADPSEEPVLEVNFLNGQQTPFMESQNGFSVDGVQWKIRHDYGVNAVGWRGAIMNPGA